MCMSVKLASYSYSFVASSNAVPSHFFIYCPIYSQRSPNDAQSQYLASPFAIFDPEVKDQGHGAKNR